MHVEQERQIGDGKATLTFATDLGGHSQMAGVPQVEIAKIVGKALTEILELEKLDPREYRD